MISRRFTRSRAKRIVHSVRDVGVLRTRKVDFDTHCSKVARLYCTNDMVILPRHRSLWHADGSFDLSCTFLLGRQ